MSIPAFCIRKRTVTRMNAAQPFMLIVVQMGNTNLATGALTPTLFSAHDSVTGRVPAEDLEKKATASAGAMPLATRYHIVHQPKMHPINIYETEQ